MTSALSIANQGHEVHLIERESDLGGMARRIHYTLEGLDVQEYLRDLTKAVYQHPSVHVYADASILGVTGYVGNFVTTVKSWRGTTEIKHGAVVIATGGDEYKPTEYLYGQHDGVLTQLELEGRIADRDGSVIGSESLVMIQCVGCRNEERNYCARVCCSQAVKNSLKLKELNPEMDIYVLFRDMRTYGFKEDYYREASSRGVRFIRYTPEDMPQVEAVEEKGRRILRVTVTDPILGMGLAIDADTLPCQPRSSRLRAARRSRSSSRSPWGRTTSSRKRTSNCGPSNSVPTACSSAGRLTTPSICGDDQPSVRSCGAGRHPPLPRHRRRFRLGV